MVIAYFIQLNPFRREKYILSGWVHILKNNMKANHILSILLSISACLYYACKKDATTQTNGSGKLNIEFENRAGNEPLVLNTKHYTNNHGDDFTISTFKYYVSNIQLKKEDGSIISIPESYFLIDAADESSNIIKIDKAPVGDYTSISCMIGVDAPRNSAGAQTGALDPAKGMYWNWNTGYIFVKMEGNSPQSTATGHKLVFHIGGFKEPTNCIRSFSSDFNTPLRIRTDKNPRLHFIADVSALFKGTASVNFADINTIMGGPNAVTIVNNYANGIFHLDHVHN